MILAVSEYHQRISPLLDTAQHVLVFSIEDTTIRKRERMRVVAPLDAFLDAHGVRILLCGAATRPLIEMIQHRRITVLPHLSGAVDEIVDLYLNDPSQLAQYRMPGCRCFRGRCGGCEDAVKMAPRKQCIKKREDEMKIAITAASREVDAPVDRRFGRSPGFVLYDTEQDTWEFVDNAQNYSSAQGAGIQSAGNIIDAGVSVVLTGNIGPKAFRVLMEGGVEAFLVEDCTVQEAVARYRDGSLTKQTSANVEGHW